MAIKNSWASGEVLLAADLTDSMKGVFVNAQTGTTYTFGTADRFVTVANASGGTATIPANATAAFNVGAVVGVMNAGTAGSFTIGTAAGVTLNAVSGATTLAPLEAATLVKLATNTWQVAKAATAVASQGLTLIATQSYSAAATVNVNNCFTSTYATYRAIIVLVGSTDGLALRCRLRAAGADYTGSQHFSFGPGFDSGNAASNISENNQTSWLLGYTPGADEGIFCIEFSNPAVSGRKDAVSYSMGSNSAGTQYSARTTGIAINTTVTARDGFTFYPASGSITGTVRVYGYGN